jgi:hypothetical protein
MRNLALILLLLTGCVQKMTHGIPNFAKVESNVWRGGEPSAEGWAFLQSLGVGKTLRLDYTNEIPDGVKVPDSILNVQGEIPPSDLAETFKAPTYHELWLRAVWIDAAIHKGLKVDPLMSKFSKMTDWEVGLYLGATMQTNSPVVFVHCLHGQDRTGIVIAFYRVLFCNWSKADAEKEMLAHGFHKECIGLWERWKKWEPKNYHQIYWE